ncbi:MAG: tetratricopeptide repeat protein [Hamadaea sp.]|nr:tetratricopeptide repeat protein [Hamadaea sp.]
MTEAAFRTDDYAPAEALLRAALDRAVREGDRRCEAAALDRLGMLTHFRALHRGTRSEDAPAELALFEQALAIRREIGDRAGIAQSLFGLGLVHQVLLRDWETAMPLFRQALAAADGVADDITLSEIHRHIGSFHAVVENDLDVARRHFQLSADLRERHGDPRWIQGGTLALGQTEVLAGRRAEAIRLLRLAVEQERAAGIRGHGAGQAAEWLVRAETSPPEGQPGADSAESSRPGGASGDGRTSGG